MKKIIRKFIQVINIETMPNNRKLKKLRGKNAKGFKYIHLSLGLFRYKTFDTVEMNPHVFCHLCETNQEDECFSYIEFIFAPKFKTSKKQARKNRAKLKFDVSDLESYVN